MTMRRLVVAVILAILVLPLACTTGDECDVCKSDQDCHGQFVCVRFTDGVMRCGSGVGATECRVP